jgi:hypothetical protein
MKKQMREMQQELKKRELEIQKELREELHTSDKRI